MFFVLLGRCFFSTLCHTASAGCWVVDTPEVVTTSVLDVSEVLPMQHTGRLALPDTLTAKGTEASEAAHTGKG